MGRGDGSRIMAVSIAKEYGNGIHVEYLPANQAYLVMWFGSRLAGPFSKEETISYLWKTLGVNA